MSAAVEKIEEQREAPDDFFGHRKRAAYSTTCHFSVASLRKSCHPDRAAVARPLHRKRVTLPSAAGGGCSEAPAIEQKQGKRASPVFNGYRRGSLGTFPLQAISCAAVEKIEEQREAPDDFFGHRKRIALQLSCYAHARQDRFDPPLNYPSDFLAISIARKSPPLTRGGKEARAVISIGENNLKRLDRPASYRSKNENFRSAKFSFFRSAGVELFTPAKVKFLVINRLKT